MPPTLTHDDVVHITGPLDDVVVAKIIESGATARELLEARRWREGYKRSLGETEPLRPSVVNRLCEIMRSDDEEWEPEQP